MKLSKGFNKVLSLVLAGAMVLTGISVADTKKADAAGAVVKITNADGDEITDAALVSAFAEATNFVVNDNGLDVKSALGVDMAKLKSYIDSNFGDFEMKLGALSNQYWYHGGTVDAFSTDVENPSSWVYSQNSLMAAYENGSKYLLLDNGVIGTGMKISLSKDATDLSKIAALKETGIKVAPGQTLKLFAGVNIENAILDGWAFDEALTSAGEYGDQGVPVEVSYDAEEQCFVIKANDNLSTMPEKAMVSLGVKNLKEDGETENVKVPGVEGIPLSAVENVSDATQDITGTPVDEVNFVQENYDVTVVRETEAPVLPTPAPTKAPASGSGSSAGGSSGSGSSTGSTSGAGTGEPTELPEDQQFEAYIGLVATGYYPNVNIGENGYVVNGFDQQNEELPQTQMVDIDSTGVYSVALTGNMATEANGVIFFALYTEMTTAIQKETGLIVKPVEVIYGSDKYETFPSSAYLADGGKMRYSFVNQYAAGKAEANPFEADEFTMVKDEGVYIKFVVAYSEEDAAKLVENYDDADTYEDILDEVKEAKEELAKATPTPAPTPTTNPDVKPTAKPTAKPTVAPTLKVAGKVTMGAKEKVTVKATTNQASVKAVSSKTSAVKASASGKNIKLTAGKKAGSANITVTAGTKKATIKVTVKAAPKKIKVAKKTVNVKRGKKATTKVKFTPKKAAAYTIKVTNASQLKKKKVTVTVVDGKITVKADKKAKKGTLTVKLQTYNKKKTTFKVKVK